VTIRKYKGDNYRAFGLELWPRLIHTPWMIRFAFGYTRLEFHGK
jgi:hypothetical protein